MEKFYFIVTVVVFAVFGLCFGSFLNVVVYRLPRGMSLAKPPSHCPHCKYRLRWFDNVPLLSYAVLRGRCRKCGARISPRYPLVEAAVCLLWALCAGCWRGNVPYALCASAALTVLLAMALIDSDSQMIPDSLQIALLVVAVGAVFADRETAWPDKLYGLCLGGGFFLLFYLLSYPMFGREGLGFGDVKLMAGAGLLLGLKATAAAIAFALAPAFLAVVLRRAACGGRDSLMDDGTFAFAPYLAFGTAAALFFGNALVGWYLNLL